MRHSNMLKRAVSLKENNKSQQNLEESVQIDPDGAQGLSDIEEYLMNNVQMINANMSDEEDDDAHYDADGYHEYETKDNLALNDAGSWYYNEGYEVPVQETLPEEEEYGYGWETDET